MNVKLKVLRKVLEEAIANIDAGNSNHSDDELDDIISSLTKLNRGIKRISKREACERISKREACERILHCSFIIKPYISRVANNYIGKLDGLLKAIEDKDGKVDIEGILSESIDNLVVAQVKKYPNVFSGVEIGGGTIKINIPSFDKQLVFDYNDIETFKQNILN